MNNINKFEVYCEIIESQLSGDCFKLKIAPIILISDDRLISKDELSPNIVDIDNLDVPLNLSGVKFDSRGNIISSNNQCIKGNFISMLLSVKDSTLVVEGLESTTLMEVAYLFDKGYLSRNKYEYCFDRLYDFNRSIGLKR